METSCIAQNTWNLISCEAVIIFCINEKCFNDDGGGGGS